MKYYLLNSLGILTTILGITTTAQAQINIHQPSRSHVRVYTSPPQARMILHNGKGSVIGTIKSSSAQSQPRKITYLTMNSLELIVYQKVNQYRQSLNLPALDIDPIVSERAKAHSEQMARTGNFSHSVDSSELQAAYPSAAQNIATSRGYSSPEIVAVRDWISSPRHHRNLIGRYNRTGVGIAQNAKGEYYFTQIFVYKR
jgi:uncharacterized protein YkwD